MADTSIEVCDKVWNPVTGCTKISPGCKHCYAERMALRLRAMGQRNYRKGFEVALHPHMLDVPLKWKKPSIIFVNSMSDLFHEEVPISFIKRVFDVMNRAHWHTFQILTKREDRLFELNGHLPWMENIWMGVSVENADYAYRIDRLRETGARLKYVCFEPLLGPIPNLDLRKIDWAIIGGESGPKSRPLEEAWVLDLRDQLLSAGIPFYFKQWGGTNKKKTGRLLQGREHTQIPSTTSTGKYGKAGRQGRRPNTAEPTFEL
jgi:protein gp37